MTRSPSGTSAVILFSGGLDSTTLAAIAHSRGHRLHALTFRYGQRHAREVEAARELARRIRFATHQVIDLPIAAYGGSALTDARAEIPKDRDPEEIGGGAIPPTYVPARNTIFLAHALAWCEVLGAEEIYIGVNALDYSGYPDCRPEFLQAFERLAALATRAGVEEGRKIRIQAPLIDKTKAEIIRWGVDLGVDYALTWSCYDPVPGTSTSSPLPCGRCDSCLLRKKGFQEASVADPTPYAA